MENPTQKLYGLISKFDTAMLVTYAADGRAHARPMGVAKIEPNCDLWFFTARESEKTREIENDRHILILFQKGHASSVALSGTARLVSDRAQIASLWQESYKVWFPGGIDDPSLMLIRVSAMEAEYWDSSGFKGIKYLFEAAKAYATHTTPEVSEPEQHGRVALK